MDDPAPTVSSIQEALQAQARERAQFTIETGIELDADGRLKKGTAMTPHEIEREREQAKAVLRDTAHPHHNGSVLLLESYAVADEKTRAFLRAIAPYMFDEHGQILNGDGQ